MKNKIIYIVIFVAIIFIAYHYLSYELKSESFSTKELKESSKANINTENTSADKKVKYFASEGNIRIAYFPYVAKDEKANLILIHGGGAHSTAGYQYIAEGLRNQYNISTYLMDLRGHGLSEGRRGDTEEVEFVYKDIYNLISLIRSVSSKPFFLSGHSSGSGVILNYISYKNTENISGFLFISPEFGYKSKTNRENVKEPFAKPRIWVFILSAISGKKLFKHTTAVYFNYPPEILDRDKLMVSSYTINMSYACTPDNPEEQFKKIDKPVKIIIGENDEVIDPGKLNRFLPLLSEKIKSKSNYKIVNNATHLSVLLHSDSIIADTISNWLKNLNNSK
jgi:acylglycerol lipase